MPISDAAGRSRSGRSGTCAPASRSSASVGWTTNSTSGWKTKTWPLSGRIPLRLARTLRGPLSRNRRSRARSPRNGPIVFEASVSAPAFARPPPRREREPRRRARGAAPPFMLHRSAPTASLCRVGQRDFKPHMVVGHARHQRAALAPPQVHQSERFCLAATIVDRQSVVVRGILVVENGDLPAAYGTPGGSVLDRQAIREQVTAVMG